MSFADRVSSANRKRKWAKFLEIIRPDAQMTVLDVGFNAREYSAVDNYLEKHYPWSAQITALGLDSPAEFRERYPLVNAVQYNGRSFPFPDKAFDVCWCNAVIEHVGGRDAQEFFLREIARVSRMAFLSTPNRRFPIEVHTRTPFLHFLPKSVFDSYLRSVGKGWATGDYMNLLSRGELDSLLSRAGVNQYAILPGRWFGFVMEYVVFIGIDDGKFRHV